MNDLNQRKGWINILPRRGNDDLSLSPRLTDFGWEEEECREIEKELVGEKEMTLCKKVSNTLGPVSLLLNAQFFIFKGLPDGNGKGTRSTAPIKEPLAVSLLAPLMLKTRT